MDVLGKRRCMASSVVCLFQDKAFTSRGKRLGGPMSGGWQFLSEQPGSSAAGASSLSIAFDEDELRPLPDA